MSSALDLDHIGPSSLDVGFGEVLHALLASLWRRRLPVGTIVAAALALGIIALLVITPSYTPEASIRGGFVASNAVAKDEDSKGAPSVSLDLMRVIETQSRLLQSQDLARRVVQQLGLERLQPELSKAIGCQTRSTGAPPTLNRTRPTLRPRSCCAACQSRATRCART